MSNAVIVKEETVPEDVWEQFCRKYATTPWPMVGFPGDNFAEHPDRRGVTLRAVVFVERIEFESDPDAALQKIETEFHKGVTWRMQEMREELNILRSAGQKSVI